MNQKISNKRTCAGFLPVRVRIYFWFGVWQALHTGCNLLKVFSPHARCISSPLFYSSVFRHFFGWNLSSDFSRFPFLFWRYAGRRFCERSSDLLPWNSAAYGLASRVTAAQPDRPRPRPATQSKAWGPLFPSRRVSGLLRAERLVFPAENETSEYTSLWQRPGRGAGASCNHFGQRDASITSKKNPIRNRSEVREIRFHY